MYIEAFKEKSQLNMDENIVWMFLSSSVYFILHLLGFVLDIEQ